MIPALYAFNIPHDLPEAVLRDAIRDAEPTVIEYHSPIPKHERLRPDQFYDWMPLNGELGGGTVWLTIVGIIRFRSTLQGKLWFSHDPPDVSSCPLPS